MWILGSCHVATPAMQPGQGTSLSRLDSVSDNWAYGASDRRGAMMPPMATLAGVYWGPASPVPLVAWHLHGCVSGIRTGGGRVQGHG